MSNTRAPYQPAPGTIAYRALSYMRTLPPNTELVTSAWASAIGVPINNMGPLVAPLLANQLVKRRQKHESPRAPFFWSIADDELVADEPIEDESPTEVINELVNASVEPPASAGVSDHNNGDAASSSIATAEWYKGDPIKRVRAKRSVQVADVLATEPKAQKATTPASGLLIAMWSNGKLEIWRGEDKLVKFSVEETRQLVQYLDNVLQQPGDAVREGAL